MWTRTGETTTLTVTASPANDSSHVVHDCGGDPEGFSLPTTFAVRTGDGRLDGSFPAPLRTDLLAALTLPASVNGSLPVTMLIGTGVVSDTFLDPTQNAVGISLQIVVSGAGAAYGSGALSVYGRDSINIAAVGPTP